MARFQVVSSSNRHRAARLACLGGALCFASFVEPRGAFGQLLPVGAEIEVSHADGLDHESDVGVAADRAGGWSVAWAAVDVDFGSLDARQRRFDRDGEALGGATPVADLESPDLALDGEGRGVLVGIRERPDLGGAQVDAICLDAAGAARGAAVRVDGGDISPATRRPSDPRVAMESDGRFVVVWTEFPRDPAIPPSVFFRRVDANCAPLGVVGDLGSVGSAGQRQPDIAIRWNGGFVITWVEGVERAAYRVLAQRFETDGAAAGAALAVTAAGRFGENPAVAVGRDGLIAIVWRGGESSDAHGEDSEVASRIYTDDGLPLLLELALRPVREANVGSVDVAALDTGFVAAWGENGCLEVCSGVFARAFHALGPAGPDLQVNVNHSDPGDVAIAGAGGSEVLLVWDELSEGGLPADIVGRRLAFVAHGGECFESSRALCLGDDRFRVEVEWRNFLGVRGTGQTVALTGDAGLFWFFDAENLELLVKTVDGCGEFGRHWLFAAATTNVEYTAHVIDTATGRSRSYFNPLGRSSPAITDTDAFATCP